MLYVSGICAVRIEDNGNPTPGPEQVPLVLKELESVLVAGGSSMQDVIKVRPGTSIGMARVQ